MENAYDHPAFAMLKGPKQSEALLQKRIALWMKATFPGIVFRSGYEGLELSDTDAKFASICNSHNGFPDLMVYDTRGGYSGLAVELKKDGAPLYKLNGELRKDAHLKEQQDMLNKLKERGWQTFFAQGEAQAMKVISTYMSLPYVPIRPGV